MNHFSIRDIENLTQIKAHTLRIWEQRYNLINPKRKASQHRYYDNEDLKYFLRISYLYHHGCKISYIASLTDQEIKRRALEIQPGGDSDSVFVNQLLESSIDFDTAAFEKQLRQAIHHAGFESCITNVVFPLLRKMGVLWLTGNVIPAQEHFASALIVKEILYRIQETRSSRYRTDKRVLLYTPAGEEHEIPLLFMWYLLKKNKTPVVYLGTNVTIGTLQTVCRQQPLTHIYFHLITNLTRCDFSEYLNKLTMEFPDHQVVFWATMDDAIHIPDKAKRLRSTAEMIAFAEQ